MQKLMSKKIKAIVVGGVVFVMAGILALIAFYTFSIGGDVEGTVNGQRFGNIESAMLQLFGYMIIALVVGILFVIFVLPYIMQKVVESIFNQVPEKYVLSVVEQARSFVQQEKFQEAIEKYRESLGTEQPDAMVWCEMSRVQLENLDDEQAAIKTMKEGRDFADWAPVDDITFMMITAGLLVDTEDSRDEAIDLYKEIISTYPDDISANNARQELLSLGIVA